MMTLETCSDIWERLTGVDTALDESDRPRAALVDEVVVAMCGQGLSPLMLKQARQIRDNTRRSGSPLAELAAEIVERLEAIARQQGALAWLQALAQDTFARNTCPSRAWHVPAPREEASIREITAQIERDQKRLAEHHGGEVGRVFHRLQQFGSDRAELIVSPEGNPRWRFGLLNNPGRYKAVVRLSSGQGVEYARDGARRVSDEEPDVRGLAFKVFTVAGRPVDFLTTNTTSSFAENVPAFLSITQHLHTAGIEGLPKGLAALITNFVIEDRAVLPRPARNALLLFSQLLNRPKSLATEEYWSSTFMHPLGYAMRVRVTRDTETSRSSQGIPSGETYLEQDLLARMVAGGLSFRVDMALYTDGPLDGASALRDPRIEPIGVLRIPPITDAVDRRETESFVKSVAFNPANFMGHTMLHEVLANPSSDPEIAGMQGRFAAYLTSSKRRCAITDDMVWAHFSGEALFS